MSVAVGESAADADGEAEADAEALGEAGTDGVAFAERGVGLAEGEAAGRTSATVWLPACGHVGLTAL